MFFDLIAQHCGHESSVYGEMLKLHVFRVKTSVKFTPVSSGLQRRHQMPKL